MHPSGARILKMSDQHYHYLMDETFPGNVGLGSRRGRNKTAARSGKGGKASRTRGLNWWSFVDTWFEEKVRAWGEKLDNAEWKE